LDAAAHLFYIATARVRKLCVLLGSRKSNQIDDKSSQRRKSVLAEREQQVAKTVELVTYCNLGVQNKCPLDANLNRQGCGQNKKTKVFRRYP
jgi:hypothetical protein